MVRLRLAGMFIANFYSAAPENLRVAARVWRFFMKSECAALGHKKHTRSQAHSPVPVVYRPLKDCRDTGYLQFLEAPEIR